MAEDKQTSFDEAMARLFKDVGVNESPDDNFAMSKAEEKLAGPLEIAIGDTLKKMQEAAPGSKDHAAYEDLKQYIKDENAFGTMATGNAIFKSLTGLGGPSEIETVFSKIVDRMDSPTVFQAAFALSGVDEGKAGAFVQRLKANVAMQSRLDTLVSSLREGLSAGGGSTPDIDGLKNSLAQNQPILAAIAKNPDGFFHIMDSDAAKTIIDKVVEHSNNGDELNQQGMADVMASFSLKEKAGMMMEMGGATKDEIVTFQAKLDKAITDHPELEAVINNAITDTITTAEAGQTGDVFGALDNASKMFAEYANSPQVEALLTKDTLIENVIARANANPDQPLTLAGLKNMAIEETGYYAGGMAMALGASTSSGLAISMGGGGINMLIQQAKNLGDPKSAQQLAGIQDGFGSMFNGGWGGMISMMVTNMPGIGQAILSTGNQFGFKPEGAAGVLAEMDRAYIFDGNSSYVKSGQLTEVNYGKIGENLKNNTWDGNGDVRSEEDRQKSPAQLAAKELGGMLKETLGLEPSTTS